MTVDIIEVLVSARKLIENPENWIKSNYNEGDKYDICGAVRKIVCNDVKAEGVLQNTVLRHVWKLLSEKLVKNGNVWNQGTNEGKILLYNDMESTTHADILALLDSVIAECKENDHEAD